MTGTQPHRDENAQIALSLAEHVMREARSAKQSQWNLGRWMRDMSVKQFHLEVGGAGQRRLAAGRIGLRELSVASGSSGGYLKGTRVFGLSDLLRDGHFLHGIGATFIDDLREDAVIPTVKTGIAGQWLGSTGSVMTPSDPVFGQTSMTPKQATAYTKYSRQLSIQAEASDAVISRLLLEAVTSMIEQAVLAGTGGEQPIGVVNTVGVGAQSGASLDRPGLLAMRESILDAGGAERKLQWVGAPDVQVTLGGREATAAGGRYLWDDNGILGRPATATAFAPEGVLVCGDWSRCSVGFWGDSIEVEVDPNADFRAALIGARVILSCDVMFSPAAAFSVSTSIT